MNDLQICMMHEKKNTWANQVAYRALATYSVKVDVAQETLEVDNRPR